MKFKKIVSFSLLFTLVLVCCTACNGDITRDIRHSGFSVGGKFICDKFYPKDKEDVSYERVRYFTGSHLINTDGKIYELSLGQNFANDQNCKEADTELTVKAIFDDKIIKATDGNYYYLTPSNNVSSYSKIPETDNSYQIYDLLLKGDNVVKVITADSSTGLYYVLRDDGNIYGIVISRKDHNTPPAVTSTKIVYNKNDYGSQIIDFNYAGESVSTFIRTREKVFRMKITNQEQCSKYADIKCEFEMNEDSIFETYKDNIIVYNGSTLITDYQQMFSVVS